MVTVSSPPPQLSPTSMVEADEVDVRRMDGLLEQLKSSMVSTSELTVYYLLVPKIRYKCNLAKIHFQLTTASIIL
ncbi:hypothetical protein TNCT_27801 [Trichonephila clavata]|uniref:Uncharacterized protein n=1 Tax=Trichonephila clavata TaxID=2740835 RepID=A0A8X6LI90_TRICU|nr:hypothetical protein TNCT_27801 [Trichonephila clavata]